MNVIQKVQQLDFKIWMRFILFLAVAVGVFLRFYKITSENFVFYDEGLYLNHNRVLGELLASHQELNMADKWRAVISYLQICMGTGKALWFLVIDSRIFFNAVRFWTFARVLSAIFGIATLAVLYRFAKRFTDSSQVAALSVILLSLLPSHVFYSRTGLQEALSTFLVLSAFYFYVFPRRFGLKTLLAGLLFGLGFFSNYRFIIAPVLIFGCEVVLSLDDKRFFDIRKYVWCILSFFALIVLGGDFFDGLNTRIVFAWIFHQMHLATETRDWINLLTYPYYLMKLENIIFALFFFGNFWLLFKRKWKAALPFIIVGIQMAIFSFTSDKAARYLCVVTPFMVLAVATAFHAFFYTFSNKWIKRLIFVFGFTMILGLLYKSVAIAEIKSDYYSCVRYLKSYDPKVKFLSTQPFVQNLYVNSFEDVKECPKTFPELLNYVSSGYRFLVLDPQAYVSMTHDSKRFEPLLANYLNVLFERTMPLKVFSHYDNFSMLERFVFEHNQNLRQSLKFLRIARERRLGAMYVYDLKQSVPEIMGLILTKRMTKN